MHVIIYLQYIFISKLLFLTQYSIIDICDLLKNLIDIQKENLEVEKQRLEIEKQTLEYHKTVGNHLLSFMPLMQTRAATEPEKSTKADSTPMRVSRKRPASSESKFY